MSEQGIISKWLDGDPVVIEGKMYVFPHGFHQFSVVLKQTVRHFLT